MDPITMMLISMGMSAGTGALTSVLGGKQPTGNTPSPIQPNNQFKSPFTMPDMYKRQEQPIDPKQSILGSADSLSSKFKLPYRPSNYFGQYINF